MITPSDVLSCMSPAVAFRPFSFSFFLPSPLTLALPTIFSDIFHSHLFLNITTAADKRGLSDINSVVKELAGRAKDGKLKPSEFQGGSFTVSNLGAVQHHPCVF